MKTTVKLGLTVSVLWLASLVFLSGTLFPHWEEGAGQGGEFKSGAALELNQLSKELHRMRRQNDELRKQAQQLRDLVEFRATDVEDNQALILQEKLAQANNILEKLNKDGIQRDSYRGDVAAEARYSCISNSPSVQQEKLLRRIHNGVVEIWYYLKAELQKVKMLSTSEKVKEKVDQMMEDAGHQQRSIIVDIYNLSRVDNKTIWRTKEAKSLSDLVQRRFQYLQNPTECNTAQKVVCNLNKGCGYGCQVHHVAYCMIVAYATQRTLILQSHGWRYAPEGWEKFFLPLSETCHDRRGSSTARWGSSMEKMAKTQVIDLPIVDGLNPRPDFLPLAIPEDLSERLRKLHGHPFVWWMGQVLKYILRPQPRLAKELELAGQRMGFQHPIVGVHVRRTDKVGTEASFHGIQEYMVHVEEYYLTLERTQRVQQRRVYLATDDASLLAEARRAYPQYVFISDNAISQSAGLASRYTENALLGVITDIHFLALSDYLVCTFSSQVCRVAYEIMQTYHPDASTFFHSLDDVYYFGGQNEHRQTALYEHKPRSRDEIALAPGDTVGVAGNHWDGYSKGRNHRLRVRNSGLYPSYKVEEVVEVAQMPTYPEVPLQVPSENSDDEIKVKSFL
ncbi:alpha-(1,6)-fucosyltransferase-like [Acanthaster planci]|uniref:Alpha-(1,6)-fucosyltransferase n=1 Tax=Acanthaster planci TaxID=133434 RepID=A0A8B7ZPZ5_ACAPL|nr:alpha-(1,6)-fucosyltransferase-like [Acanthaster planci]XP_022106972.1 alpha-(1,6)-fucosyltransferase-like [Acanthaster planci]XP_022106973.1 alpha-(1,6)-fucosyltransferase-like [Acanthaster planci]XP_022106974.1 alpha-(1,6)-fucosyltransferase-like [Acanthaster planci]XP_022106975.1 alpha-(1,6)-fucosyltransferase-like [Acanthaster planci]XP_022106976.1 alpha-(1,6)-fucosyltransferase-like [Acanthaster planci]XP_022106977.1 alpha-(1,6)-fucosyltransferase-like [Acanthaster planci]XP_02210697